MYDTRVCVCVCVIEVVLMSVIVSSYLMYFILSATTDWTDTGNSGIGKKCGDEVEDTISLRAIDGSQ